MVYNFTQISEALRYIDKHLDETLTLEFLSEKYCFSPYYFHRLFSAVVGKSLAAYVRERRVLYSCISLCMTEQSILDIALTHGFNSAQAFSRAFKVVQGVPPSMYRLQNNCPSIISVDELIINFTNRLKGGILVDPIIKKQDKLIISGTYGEGCNTAEVWSAFEKLSKEKPLKNALSDDGYEVRIYENKEDEVGVVYVGNAVSSKDVDPAYTVIELPASKYASFDVYVAKDYCSENDAMDEWLASNKENYKERVLENGKNYCVEYYSTRYNGDSEDSIVEIWIPIER